MFFQCTYSFVSEPVADLFDAQSCVPGQLFLLLLAGIRAGPVLLKPAVKDGCDSGSEVTRIVIYTALVGNIRTGGGDHSSKAANVAVYERKFLLTSLLSPSSTMSSPVATADVGYTGLTTSPVSEADSGYTSASLVDMTTSDDVTNMNSPYLGNRKYLNPQAIELMELWYQDNQQHAYPSILDLNKLAHDGHITVAQVRKWMANKRMRSSNTTSRKPGKAFVRRQRRVREVSCSRAVVSSSCSDTADHSHVDHYPRHFTPRVTAILNSWFKKNRFSPYPSEEEKEQLARDTILTVKQIRYWFANKRTRTMRKHNVNKDSQDHRQEQLHQFRQQSVQFLSQLCAQNS